MTKEITLVQCVDDDFVNMDVKAFANHEDAEKYFVELLNENGDFSEDEIEYILGESYYEGEYFTLMITNIDYEY